MSPPEPTGVLVIRAWVESGAGHGLRAVVRSSLDVTTGDEQVSTEGTVDGVCDAVRAWLLTLIERRQALRSSEEVD